MNKGPCAPLKSEKNFPNLTTSIAESEAASIPPLRRKSVAFIFFSGRGSLVPGIGVVI